MTEERRDKRDFWGKLESSAKIFAGVGAGIGAIAIPFLVNQFTEESRKAQVFMQIMTEREKSDTSIRENMFQHLLKGYLGVIKEDLRGDAAESTQRARRTDEESIRDSFKKRIVFLDLLTVNFQEYFNAKPLFADLYERLGRHKQRSEDKQAWAELQNDIVKVSKNIASRQALVLNTIGQTRTFSMEPGDNYCVRLYDVGTFRHANGQDPLRDVEDGACAAVHPDVKQLAREADDPKGSTKQHSIEVYLTELRDHEVKVAVTVYYDFFDKAALSKDRRYRHLRKGPAFEFGVSYFDLPYMDNTQLFDGSRFALRLKDILNGRAYLETISFSEDFMSLRDRPLFEEMLQKLKD